jgi:hypothetical protein
MVIYQPMSGLTLRWPWSGTPPIRAYLNAVMTRRPRREKLVGFEGLNGCSAGNDSLERGAEVGNVPLSVAEFIELPPDPVLWRDFEYEAEGAVREADGQVGFEHEQAFADRLHKIQWNDFAHCEGSRRPKSVRESIAKQRLRVSRMCDSPLFGRFRAGDGTLSHLQQTTRGVYGTQLASQALCP